MRHPAGNDSTGNDSTGNDSLHDLEERPTNAKQVFASIFTPNWTLAALACLGGLLPFCKGCNGETFFVYQFIGWDKLTLSRVVYVLFILWGFLFALIVIWGNLRLALTRDPRRAFGLWLAQTLLDALIAVLSTFSLYDYLAHKPRVDLWFQYWEGCAIAGIVLPIITGFSKDWFKAAIGLQCCLAMGAALWYATVAPTLMFAERPLIGAIMTVTCFAFLAVASLLVRLDGRRALTRTRSEPLLRLNSRSTFLLWTLACMACCLSIGFSLTEWDWDNEQGEAKARMILDQAEPAKLRKFEQK